MAKHYCSLCNSPLHEDVKITLHQKGNFDIKTRPCRKCNLLHDKNGSAISMEGKLVFLATDEQISIDSMDSLLGGEEETVDKDTAKKYLM